MTSKNKAHHLVYSLLYPGVLGSLLLALINSLINSNWQLNLHIAFALFLLLYFISQWVQRSDADEEYTWSKLIFDFAEIALIISIYVSLGIFTQSSLESLTYSSYLFSALYLSFSISLLFPVLERFKKYKNWMKLNRYKKTLTLLSLTVFSLSITFYVTLLTGMKLLSHISIILMYAFLIFYFIFISQNVDNGKA